MEGRRQHLANRRPQLRTQNFGILGTLRREVSRLTPPWFGFRDFAFVASNGREGRDTCRFSVRIGGKIRPKNLRDLAAKRSHSHVHPGGLTGGCAPARGAERRTKHGTQNA